MSYRHLGIANNKDRKENNECNPVQILDQYVITIPTVQNAIDIFKGEWTSKFLALPETSPFGSAVTSPGYTPLFEDSRIEWMLSQIGGCKDFSVLELGPLEGGHTYMLEQAGAKSILSVESNTRAFLKCLITKEVMNLKNASFVLGDFCEYLKNINGDVKYDLIIASGVLYHMKNPVRLLADISRHTEKVFLWTHYYDPDIIMSSPVREKIGNPEKLEEGGFSCEAYRYEYKTALEWIGFCGGTDVYSRWIGKDDIIDCLKHFGFKKITIGFDHPDHINGPSFALMCSK